MRQALSRILCAAMAVWFGLAGALPVSAAVLTGRRDVMSRQAPLVASNHEIRFITPTGVDSPTDTITIDFPIGFDLSTVVFGDIDLYHGAVTGFETNETIAASPAAGVWGAAVSGRTLTLTAPSDAAAGEIPASNIVNVRIGTNAIGGTHQIVNPSGGGGPVTISLGGTFGDVGGIEVFIGTGTSDTISVSAVVAAPTTTSTPPGPGGGGGGPGVDGTPPIISNVQVINITTSTATVIWQTDEPATSRVDYGTTIAYGGVATSSGLVTSHSVQLRGLPQDTLIHFKVTSSDAVGNTAMTGDFTFHTLPPPVAPIITNVHLTGITDTSAVVAWDTNIPANSFVEYGLTNAYGSNASNGAFVTSHNVSLFGLTEGTLYHFRVQSSEPSAGLTAVSGDFTFMTTADTTAPANVLGFTATPGDHHNNLSWSNPSDPDFSFVRIRARTDGYPSGPNDGRLVYQGSGTSMMDSGLVNGATYFYANYAFDSHGNGSSGAFAQSTPFGTLPPPVTPPLTTPPTTPPGGPGGGGSTTTHPVVPPGSSTTTPPVVTPPGSTTTTPPIILPPPETPSSPGVTITPSYYGGAGGILLEPDSSGAVGILAGSSVLVRVPVTGLPSPVKSGIIRVGNSVYSLTPIPGGQEYGATFIPSRNAERVEAIVQLTLVDGRLAAATTVFETKAYGRVLERPSVFTDLAPIDKASVTIYQSSNGTFTLWPGARYGQPNPYVTGANGVWGFNIRNGNYRIVVEKEGYETQTKDFQVTNNVASFDVILPANITIPFIGPLLEALQTEDARTTANLAGPIIAVLAIANLAAAASLFSILNYLWFLLTQPILLLGRKRRDKWGIVYNSLTKQPVELAAVRLINVQTRAIVQTRISDAQGRFAFTVKPGTYRLEVVKQGYAYPTALLKDQKEDGDFLDVYHGEEIVVKEDSNIAVNIPLDPDVKMETPNSVILKAYLRKFQTAFALIGVVVSFVALIISPSWWMAALVVFQILTFFLFWRLAKPKKPKTWGIVYNSGNRLPEGTTVVRIFDKKFNKLLETQVSNSKGQYGFIASKNTYFITAEKPGFEKYRSEDIDLTNAKEAVIDKHVPLKKVG